MPTESVPLTKREELRQQFESVVQWAYHNGEFMSYEQAVWPVKVHLGHYASLVFEGIRYMKGVGIFLLDEHLDRLFETSVKLYGFGLPSGFQDWDHFRRGFRQAILWLVALNEGENSYVRPWIGRGLRPHEIPHKRSGLHVRPVGTETLYGCVTEDWPTYINVASGQLATALKYTEYERPTQKTHPTAAKGSANYVIGGFASQAAWDAGANEGLMGRTGPDGEWYPLDGPGQAIAIVTDGVLISPDPEEEGILRSTTLMWVFTFLAPRLGIPCRFGRFTYRQLLEADELIYFGSASGIVPFGEVWEFDRSGSLVKHKINSGQLGPVSRALKDEFDSMMAGDPDGLKFFTRIPEKCAVLEMLVQLKDFNG